MHIRKGLWFGLLAITSGLRAELPVMSRPIPVELPPVTVESSRRFVNSAVGASGTNGVFVWTEPAEKFSATNYTAPTTTNLWLTRVSGSGQPLEGLNHLIATNVNGYGPIRLLPSDSGFFVVYLQATNTPPHGYAVFSMQIDFDGRPLVPPRQAFADFYNRFDAASNGRSLLVVWDSAFTNPPQLHYSVINERGDRVATSTIGPVFANRYAAGSDGTNYLVVSEHDFKSVATRVLAKDAVSTTITNSDYSLGVNGIGHSSSGYLVATSHTDPRFLNLDEAGNIVNSAHDWTLGTGPVAIYSDGDGWIAFSSTGGTLRASRIGPNGTNLVVQRNVYQADNQAVDSHNYVAPLQHDKYLVTESDGFALLTSSGLSSSASPALYKSQSFAGLVASAAGYLIGWREFDNQGSALRVVRWAKDGSRIDAHSIVIGDIEPYQQLACVFDGNDYVLGWNDRANATHIARISPIGAADVRVSTMVFPDGPTQFSLLVRQGGAYVTYGGATNTEQWISKLSATGGLGPRVLVHGESVVSDGQNLYSIHADASGVYLIGLDPNAAVPEISTNKIAPWQYAFAASLQNSFVVVWGEFPWNISYFVGREQKFSTALSMAPEAFAESGDRLLVREGSIRVFDSTAGFAMIDLQSHEVISAGLTPLASAGPRVSNIATAGKDFLCIRCAGRECATQLLAA